MRVIVAAVGKLKDSEEKSICARYTTRFAGAGRPVGLGPLEIREIPESRAATAELRKSDEAKRLLMLVKDAPALISLEPKGLQLSSADFAYFLRRFADDGQPCAFVLGGPDGHGREVQDAAQADVSLGLLTLPHGLARVVLIEQLYRAATILSGHPYHRV